MLEFFFFLAAEWEAATVHTLNLELFTLLQLDQLQLRVKNCAGEHTHNHVIAHTHER